jgi:hypothetical protein
LPALPASHAQESVLILHLKPGASYGSGQEL